MRKRHKMRGCFQWRHFANTKRGAGYRRTFARQLQRAAAVGVNLLLTIEKAPMSGSADIGAWKFYAR